MALYYNSQVGQNGVNKGVQFDGEPTAVVVFNAAPSLSGTTLSATWVDTTGTNTYHTSAGIVEIDGNYQARRPIAASVLASGGANPYTSGVSAVNVTFVGSGYFGPNFTYPTVTFSSPDSGTNVATGTAVVANGTVTGVTITNAGSGYATPPTIAFTAPPTQIFYVQLKDRQTLGFLVPTAAAATTNTVTLTAAGHTVVGPTQIRLRRQGQV